MAIETRPQLPHSAVAGPEAAALAPFYRDWTWTGRIDANGMDPGSPGMSGVGRAVCRLIQNGLWYACDFEQEQRLTDGTFVLRWQLHWVPAGMPRPASTAPAAPTTMARTWPSTAAGSTAIASSTSRSRTGSRGSG